jgi:DNA modification methylase
MLDKGQRGISYEQFLRNKISIAPDKGLIFLPEDVSTSLKPHERDSVLWMLKGGQRALFSSFGLGKTITQLETMRLICTVEKGKCLIVTPLNIVHVFQEDAQNLLNGLHVKYIKTQEDAENAQERILITNYERIRDGDIQSDYFTAVSLDEASVLRSFGSKTYQEFLPRFQNVKYKFVATATPSPNKYKELIHYAGFLGIMDTGQALTRFFHRDSTKANNLTLYPHMENEFWAWVSTWALFLIKPSDLGYSDEGYTLPKMKIIYHKVEVDDSTAGFEDNGQGKLMRDAAIGLKDAAKEKRDSLSSRINEMKKIINSSPDDHFVIWHDLEAERYAIQKSLPEVSEVFGSQGYEKNTEITLAFEQGKVKYLATKPDISGQGCNMQYYCHKAVFLGIGYKFNDFIQAVHRIYRFGQKYSVEIHIIYAESEQAILNALQEKWKQHNYLVARMEEIIKRNGLSSTNTLEKLARTMGVVREEADGNNFRAIFNDNCLELPHIASSSIDLIHTSIPFSNHYEYTPTYNDFGHNADNGKFFEQMDYLTPELLRVLKAGRICAVHVKDRILFGNATGTGMPTVDPFSDMTVFHFMKHGFEYMGRIVILTDVVRENNQTYRLGWTENCKDGTKMGIGCPEYVLLFRKLPTDTSNAYADTPVSRSKEEYTRAHWQIDASVFWRSSGNTLVSAKDVLNCPVSNLALTYKEFSRTHVYDYNKHVELAEELEDGDKLPSSFGVMENGSWSGFIWDDVNRMSTLNSEQSRKELAMHICPLQIDVVKRIIDRFSAKGETVLDPFAGLFTVPYEAVKMGRYGIGIELNHESFHDGLKYLQEADENMSAPTLFDTLDLQGNTL